MFFVPGKPTAKGRARARVVGKFAQLYTPQETRSYESLIRAQADLAMAGRPPLQRPVRMEMAMCVDIPSSWSKRRHDQALQGMVAATKKPDMDNVLKSCLDAMNNIVYDDDNQVVTLVCQKFYGLKPGVQVTVSELPLERA